MKKVEIAQRVKYYLKYLSYYTLGIGVACIMGDFVMIYNQRLGGVIGLALSVFSFYRLHFSLGSALINSSYRKRIVEILPIVAISTVLLTLKIYVIESNPFGVHPLVSQQKGY